MNIGGETVWIWKKADSRLSCSEEMLLRIEVGREEVVENAEFKINLLKNCQVGERQL